MNHLGLISKIGTFLILLVVSVSAPANENSLPEYFSNNFSDDYSVSNQYSTIDFGMQPLGARRSQTIRFSNTSHQMIQNLRHTLIGDISFQVMTNCMPNLSPGRVCDYVITFFCAREGRANALLTVQYLYNNRIYTNRANLTGICNRLDAPGNPPNPPVPRPPVPRP